MKAFIAVGSNLGNRESYLETARRLLESEAGIHFLRASRTYETDPVGGPPQGKFLNAVWEIETDKDPRALLESLLEIESDMGRIRSEKHAPREIDLDLLAMENTVQNEDGLILPHPRLHERRFVLEPLCELAPDWMHPVLQKKSSRLLAELHEINPSS